MSVELPKDAEGREIPLDTTVLYDKDGSRREVDWFKFCPGNDKWDVVFKDSYAHFLPHNLSLTPSDSWERLAEDSQMTPSLYCERYNIEPRLGGKVCAMMADIVARAKELGGAE